LELFSYTTEKRGIEKWLRLQTWDFRQRRRTLENEIDRMELICHK
jgi:hypothetical protein